VEELAEPAPALNGSEPKTVTLKQDKEGKDVLAF
jgi:hypothetical protein